MGACSQLLMHLQVGAAVLQTARGRGDLQSLKLCFKPRQHALVLWPWQPQPSAAAAASQHVTLCIFLQIRDFYLLTSLKHGSAVLEPGGLQGRNVTWSQDDQLFQAWAQGKTGFPFVDACMTELAATGWMSNRCGAGDRSWHCLPAGVSCCGAASYPLASALSHQI